MRAHAPALGASIDHARLPHHAFAAAGKERAARALPIMGFPRPEKEPRARCGEANGQFRIVPRACKYFVARAVSCFIMRMYSGFLPFFRGFFWGGGGEGVWILIRLVGRVQMLGVPVELGYF